MTKLTKTLVTVSKPGQHYAIINGLMSSTFSTEIELVKYLNSTGIDLKQYRYFNSVGNGLKQYRYYLITFEA